MSDIRIDAFRPTHGADQDKALDQLRRNLGAWGHDALTLLADDLRSGTVKRGTWDGCVLSYRLGEAGSAHAPAAGEQANTFILLWDRQHLAAPTVLREVEAAIARRRPAPLELPSPAEVAAPAELPAPAPAEVLCPAS